MKISIFRYLSDMVGPLGRERAKLPWLCTAFVGVALLDILGISMIGGYITIVTQGDSFTGENLSRWLTQFQGMDADGSSGWKIGLVLVALFFFKGVVGIALNKWIVSFAAGQMARLRVKVMANVQRMPFQEFSQRNSAEYIQTIIDYIGQYTSSLLTLLRLIAEGVVAVSLLIFLGFIDPLILGLLSVSAIFILFGFDKLFRRRVNKAGKVSNKNNEGVVRTVNEAVGGLREIKILGVDKWFLNAVFDYSKNVSRAWGFLAIMRIAPRYVVDFIVIAAVVGLVWLFQSRPGGIEASYPVLGMFGFALMRLSPTIGLTIASITTLRGSRHAVGLLNRELELIPSASDISRLSSQAERKAARENFKSLELRRVSFSYSEEKSDVAPFALHNVCFNLRSGEAIGVVGGSGAGKTTLINLILGLLEPSQGSVLVNDRNISSGLDRWWDLVAYLPQEIFLIDGTIQENIALGIPDKLVDDTLINDVINKVALEPLLDSLPTGKDTRIGERGIRLSGGQRQRIALARALYHERQVLILDEATSALDQKTERQIVSHIKNLKGEKTIVVIAHRLTTLEACDQIYEVHQGILSLIGSYSDLCRRQ